jgi:protein O-GlcNAc transferase
VNAKQLVEQSRVQVREGDLQGAISSLEQLCGLVQSPAVHAMMGGIFRAMCQVDDALRCYATAYRLSGNDAFRLRAALTLPPIMGSRASIAADRARMEEQLTELLQGGIQIDDPVKMIPHLAFYLAYHGENDRPLQQLIAQVVAAATPSLRFVSPHVPDWAGPTGSRVEIVFVSSHLKNHTIGRLNRELIRLLDRSRYRVTVAFVDGIQDSFAQAIADSADAAITLPRNLPAARDAVAGLGADILYYTDIGMDPFTWLLAHARLAPIQVVTWGHSMTTGLDTLDCWVSGKDTEVDQGQDHYSEPLVRLSDPTTTYRRPVLQGPRLSRAQLGLPEQGTIYLCPQTTFKLHPDFDPVMGEILRGDPHGHICLPSPKEPAWKPVITRRMREHLDTDRLVWLPKLEHQRFLQVLAAADVLIDPLIYGGCNTSLEALAMGTPIVTLPSSFLRDRYTAAWYKAVGVTDCIVETTEQYVELTLRLGQDPALRDSIMARVAERDDQLFGNSRSVDEHQALFEQLIEDKTP